MGEPVNLPDCGPICYEPFNRPEDVLYEGSEDEDYATPAGRRLRIEAAAHRFLDGEIPFIVSAQLRGPFTRESGWQNPWSGRKQPCHGMGSPDGRRRREMNCIGNSSKRHENGLAPEGLGSQFQLPLGQTSLWSPAEQDKANSHQTANSPSPPMTLNPYMEDAVVARVRLWREEIQSEGPIVDDLEEPMPEDSDDSSPGRRRKRSAKLAKPKPTILKRRKTKELELPSVVPLSGPQTNAAMHMDLPIIAATRANKKDDSNAPTETQNPSLGSRPPTTRRKEPIPTSTRLLRSSAGKAELSSRADVVMPTSATRKVVKKTAAKKPAVKRTTAHKSLINAPKTTVRDHQEVQVPGAHSSSLSDGFPDRSFESRQDESFHYRVPRQNMTDQTTPETPDSLEHPQSSHKAQATAVPSHDEQSPPDAVPELDAVSAIFPKPQDDSCAVVNDRPESARAEQNHESPANLTPKAHHSLDPRLSQKGAQSPWNGADEKRGQIAAIETIAPDNNTTRDDIGPEDTTCDNSEQAGQISASLSPLGVETALDQSPHWKETPTIRRSQERGELRTMSPQGFKSLQNMANQAMGMLQHQSPWKRDEEPPRLVRPTSFHALSPPDSVERVQGDLVFGFPTGQGSVAGPGEDGGCPGSQPAPSSEPDMEQSSLPTPDFKLSNKSRRHFKTPSPKQPRQVKRVSLASSPLPSTQALIEATLANPWVGPSSKKKSKKQVSFGPLPGESGYGGADPAADEGTGRSSRARAYSPPPRVSVANLPRGDNQIFAKHFAAAVGRRPSAMARSSRPARPLLPSESQQACASPAVEAMAEAFLDADALKSARQEDARVARLDQSQKESSPEDPLADTYDPIRYVLDNLDDFLGPQWDIDAELEKARTETARQARGN